MSALYVEALPPTGEVRIEGEEFRHGIRSLRYRPGERVWLTDGRGHLAEGLLQQVGPNWASVTLLAWYDRPGEPPYPLAVVAPPLKQPARLEWLVEKAVELGATELHFLRMARAVRTALPQDRLKRVAFAALKQNRRSVLPSLHWHESWDSLPWERFPSRLMGEIGAPLRLSDALVAPPAPTLLLVGPEGDLTPEELSLLKEKSCTGVNLGQLRLRAETAALLLLSAIKTQWGY